MRWCQSKVWVERWISLLSLLNYQKTLQDQFNDVMHTKVTSEDKLLSSRRRQNILCWCNTNIIKYLGLPAKKLKVLFLKCLFASVFPPPVHSTLCRLHLITFITLHCSFLSFQNFRFFIICDKPTVCNWNMCDVKGWSTLSKLCTYRI